MADYSKGKIYKIVNDINNDIYIGSTVQQLSNRMGTHRSFSKIDKYKSPIYTNMRGLGAQAFKIILLENYPCASKEELIAREQHWIDELKPKLNERSATKGMTEQEYKHKWYIDHGGAEAAKQQYVKNKEVILARQALVRNSEGYKEKQQAWARAWREKNKEKLQAKRDANKEAMKEYNKQYWAKLKARKLDN